MLRSAVAAPFRAETGAGQQPALPEGQQHERASISPAGRLRRRSRFRAGPARGA